MCDVYLVSKLQLSWSDLTGSYQQAMLLIEHLLCMAACRSSHRVGVGRGGGWGWGLGCGERGSSIVAQRCPDSAACFPCAASCMLIAACSVVLHMVVTTADMLLPLQSSNGHDCKQ